MKCKIILLTLVVAAIPGASVRADLIDNLSVDIRLGSRPPPPPPAVIVLVPDNDHRDPNQWESREHWYQSSRAYYYYPGADVYYRSSDQVWFYLERDQWRSSRNLPDYVRVDFNCNVTLTMFTDQPYRFHSQVVARYPSNYFGTRVRLRDDKHSGDHKQDDDHDSHDKGHDSHDKGHDGHDKGHDNPDKDKERHDDSKAHNSGK